MGLSFTLRGIRKVKFTPGCPSEPLGVNCEFSRFHIPLGLIGSEWNSFGSEFTLKVIWGKGICANILCYKCENIFSKTDIPAITLIVYSCISVKYRKYKAGIDDYSFVFQWIEREWFARFYVQKDCVSIRR